MEIDPKGRVLPYRYTAYGVNLASEIPLPDLRASESEPDASVVIRRLSVEEAIATMSAPEKFDRTGCTVHVSPEATLYDWDGIAVGLVSRGREIAVDPEPGTPTNDLAPLVVGALFGILLSHRGALVLHGSFVKVNGRGFGFLGDKGMGKSTLAAYITSRGHELVTDDLLPVYPSSQGLITRPGYPRIRLWPDSFGEVGLGRQMAEESSSLIPKGAVRPERFSESDEIPVDALFVLDIGERVSIERLSQKEALIELIRNSYLNRYLDASRKTADNFLRCEELARRVPVFRLNRPIDYEFLPSVARLLEDLNLEKIDQAAK